MILFCNGLYTPEHISDAATRNVLVAVGELFGDRLHPADLLASIVMNGGEATTDVLVRSIRSGYSPQDLWGAAQRRLMESSRSSTQPRTRAAFSPRTLAALDEYLSRVQRAPQGEATLSPVRVLLTCTLVQMNSGEHRDWIMLDLEKLLRILRNQESGGGPPLSSVEDGPHDDAADDILPAHLASCDDLSALASRMPPGAPSPYDQDPLYEPVFDELARRLYRRQPRHVILTGERGVGMITLVSELARRAKSGRIPFLSEARFLRIDCRFIPEDESRRRLVAIFAHLAAHGEVVACIDGFSCLLSSAQAESNAKVLMSALSRMRGRIIGLCSHREFENQIATSLDLREVFSRIQVPEPDVVTATRLLGHYAAGLEQAYRVSIDSEAVRSAAVLSANYILHEQLPGKAVRILNDICQDIDYERSQLGTVRNRVTRHDVIHAVSAASGVPPETLRGIAEHVDYERSLSEMVVGQEHVVKEVAAELGLIKAGLTDPGKPASVMLFIGQTGTGKTEMAKALARFYSASKRLRIYTLGNFVEPHSVSGIIGVPAGYVGHDQGGRLVNDLSSDPYGVVLLDEADKAHPDVLQPFLNLFDEGWVRDQRGVQAFADKAIFILTANVGQRMIADMAKQGKTVEEMTSRMKEALSQIRHGKTNRPVFPPELLARIKRIILFKPLDQAAMLGICRKLVGEAQLSWQQNRQRNLEIADRLTGLIAAEAHRINEKSEGREGGRIVRKLIADVIDSPIQHDVTDRPDDYHRCATLVVDCEASREGDPPWPPNVSVRFVAAETDDQEAADQYALPAAAASSQRGGQGAVVLAP